MREPQGKPAASDVDTARTGSDLRTIMSAIGVTRAMRLWTTILGGTAVLVIGTAVRAPELRAQTIELTAETENFRAAPRGVAVATIRAGARLHDATREGAWYRATLRGWIWAASVESAGRPERLRVTARAGENLRSAPNGDVLARLAPDAVLTELERRDRWVRVERTAWIWAASVRAAGEPPVGEPVAPTAATPARQAAPVPDQAAEGATATRLRAGAAGVALLHSPDGDTLARIRPMTSMEVVARRGNWLRVHVDGWVWQPGLDSGDSGAVLRDVGAALLAANPENFRGRILEWPLQFISLERAERIRTDFYEGEPFMLARGPGEESAFVYVAVPPERVAEVQRLGPLERIVVVGRIRTARSEIMGAPVLDLLELRRAGE